MGRKRPVDTGRLEFKGKLVLTNAERLRRKLVTALERERTEISFGEVKEVDLSFLQLLCSALRTAAATGREMTVSGGPVPQGVRELVAAAGIQSNLGRREDGFWSLLAGEKNVG